ncbi:RNB domain-containing ribonuclease [Paraburkholderia sp. EG287A]|uniref:RNB domain-containing ribonuclease n=1 Tax=Paraburkholderia sp. EG287A TaxID=3237012 RepID=UPI0034D255B9
MRRRTFASSPELDQLLGSVVLEHIPLPGHASVPERSPAADAAPAPRPAARASAPAQPVPVRACATPFAGSLRGLRTLRGRVNLNPRGFGFILSEEGDSYFLRASRARALLTGDVVEFAASESAVEGKEACSILSVKREPGTMLCEVKDGDIGQYLVPDEPCFLTLVMSTTQMKLRDGDVVSVAVPAYCGAPSVRAVYVAVLRNLGQRSREGFDLDYARARYGFHEAMPGLLGKEALASAKLDTMETSDAWSAHAGTPFVTIDGESTRDLDDAVYARRLDGGGYEVQVAIADVSWYVRHDTGLDAWAGRRCTSLYLPGCVVPMLPESLSTDRCSLMPDVPRRAVIMTLQLDALAQVCSSSLQRGVITSAARLSYGQVAAFMSGRNIRFAQPVEASLVALGEVYALLSAQRDAAGRLDFDDPEPTLVQEGGSWRIRWEARNDAHRLVEELMLLANRTAATMLVERYGAGLFRHQPPPDADSWRELRDWAQGEDQELPEAPSMRALAGLATAFGNSDAQAAAALRIRTAMQPARYVVQSQDIPGGHFSLSMNWYTHFTSPIRRYADLLVHRLLLAPEGTQFTAGEWEKLAAQVAQCSERSHAARLAERMVWDRLKLAGFMKDTLAGAPVRARVVRATARGLRVVIQGWQCSGWLSGDVLREQGFQYVDDVWVGTAGSGSRVLAEGTSALVSWRELSRERPAYPELQLALVTEAN